MRMTTSKMGGLPEEQSKKGSEGRKGRENANNREQSPKVTKAIQRNDE